MQEFNQKNQKLEDVDRVADIIVLGVGTCGEDLSLQLLTAGVDVIGIEANLVGGECPYWACLPSKTMLRAAKTLQEARRVNEKSGEADVHPNWDPVAERVRWITGSWDDSTAIKRYQSYGGHMVKGRGKLIGPRTVAVGDQTFTAKQGIVIATGSKPFIPPIKGIEKVDYWTTHDLIAMENPPESLIVIGGGASGCELGQVVSRFGTDVTIVEAKSHLLPREEPEAGDVLQEAFEAEGIDVRTGARAEEVAEEDGLIKVTLDDGTQLEAERVLIAAGREIDLSDLGLETIGLDPDAKSIPVDERMRVMDGIWAMGDVTGKSLLTHVAVYQDKIIAADILGKEHPPARYDAVPRGTFTDPEVASVGLTESKATHNGDDVEIVIKQMPYTFRGVIDGVERGVIKLVVDREEATLVGGSIVGPNATDMLGILNLAVHAKIPLKELRTMMYAFPAFYGAIGEAIGAWGQGVTLAIDPEYEGAEVINKLV